MGIGIRSSRKVGASNAASAHVHPHVIFRRRPNACSRGSHRSHLFAFAIVLLAAGSATQPAAGQHARIVGLGATGCAEFISEIRQNPALQRDYLAWAQGYMSGILLSRPVGVDEGLDLVPKMFPLLKQLEFLREHCTQNPSADFADAVVALYKRLRKEGTT